MDFSQFRCTFRIRRGDWQAPNTCDLRIYNLKDETVKALTASPNTEFTAIAIQAGYGSASAAGSYGLIFKGFIKQAREGREDQLNSYVDITAAHGDEAYDFATVLVSLAAGSSPSSVFTALANSADS